MTSILPQLAMLIVCCISPIIALPAISIPLDQQKSSEPFKVIPFCDIYKTSHDLSAEEAAEQIELGTLQKTTNTASQGFSKDFYWIAFTLNSKKYAEQWILELDNPHIDDLVLYQWQDQWQIIGFGGDRDKSFTDRSYINRRYVFPLNSRFETTRYLLKVDKRNASVSFPLKLWRKEHFFNHESTLNLIFGIYFGMLLFVSLVSLVFGAFIRKQLLILYGTYALSMILYQFTALGLSYQFLYPHFGQFNNYSRLLLIVLISILSIAFSRNFLELKKHAFRVDWALRAINFILVGLLFSWILFFDLFTVYTIWVINTIYFIILSIFILSLLGLIKVYKFKKRHATTYIAAFGALIIACCLYIGVEYGLINESVFVINPIMIGSGLEIMIFALFMLKWSTDLIKTNNPLFASKNPALLTEFAFKTEQNQIKPARNESQIPEQQNCFLELKDHQKINHQHITHIKSDGHYLLIYIDKQVKPTIERMTFNEALAQLPKSFIRTHRSYLVNVLWISHYKSTQVHLKNSLDIPLSRTYKGAFLEHMNQHTKE